MKRIISAFALAAAFTCSAFASDKEELQKNVLSYQSFKADFAQTVTNASGTVVTQSSGLLALKRPDHLMMHTKLPEEQVLYTKGSAVIFYDPFIEQASIYDKNDLYSSPFMLLTSKAESVWGKYDIEKTSQGYRLTPKTAQEVSYIELELSGNIIKAISIKMKDGNTNRYDLKNVSNTVADSVFEYSIPDGTQIDDERRSN